MSKVTPRRRWLNAEITIIKGVEKGVKGEYFGIPGLPYPEEIAYVVICSDGRIVGWPSFEKAGDLAERLEITVVNSIAPTEFLRRFAKYFNKEYVRLPHRGSEKEPCFHLVPVPPELLKRPPLIGLGGACSISEPFRASV